MRSLTDRVTMRIAPGLFLFALLMPSCATVHRPSARARPPARTVALPDRECDDATNGALIGAAIGAVPFVALLVPPEGEQDIPYMVAGSIGAIVGFWIGIGVDEAHCHPKE